MMDFTAEDYIVKAVVESDHSRGRYFRGNLYKGSVRFATFEEMGQGGPMEIHSLNEELYDDFVSYSKVENADKSLETEAMIIENLVEVFSIRKQAMNGRKKRTIIQLESNPLATITLSTPYSEKLVDWIQKEYPEENFLIANEVFDIYPDGVDRIFREEE